MNNKVVLKIGTENLELDLNSHNLALISYLLPLNVKTEFDNFKSFA